MRYQAKVTVFKEDGNLITRKDLLLRYRSIIKAQLQPGNRITTISSTTTTATATTEKPHGLETGDTVVITGAVNANHNKASGVAVTVTGQNTFTYTITSTNATSTNATLWEVVIDYYVPGFAKTLYSTPGTLTAFTSLFDLGQFSTLTDRAGSRPTVAINIEHIKGAEEFNAPAISVSGITRSSSTATVTTSVTHGLTSGDYVTIAGAGESDYNVTAVITVTTPTRFTYTVANSPTSPATGTITATLTYTTVQLQGAGAMPDEYNFVEDFTVFDAATDTEEALSLPDGNATTPGLTFDSDPNTGFYRVGSGEIGVSSNGTETVQLGASGVSADTINELTPDAGVIVDGVQLLDGAVIKGTATVAADGSDQTGASQLASDYNNITGADGSKGVKLPAVSTGRSIVVSNTDNSGALKVYPNTGGKINRGSANASVTVAANTTVVFIGDLEATTDYSMFVLGSTQYVNSIGELTSGSGVSFLNHRKLLVQTGITANSGGGQGSAVALTGDMCYVTVCAAAGDSVLLPAAVAGLKIEVNNTGAASANVFPRTGETIAGGSANAAYAVGVGQTQVFSCNTAGAWQVSIAGSIGVSDIHLTTPLGTGGAATVSVKEYGDGYNMVTQLTLTNFVVGALAGAAANLALGSKIYTFPAGAFVLSATYASVGLTAAGTANTPNVGIGSVVGTGAVNTLAGTATFMDYWTQQTAPDLAGTATVGLKNPTAGVQSGIALNLAASVKDVFLNAAAAWAANNTGNLTASGTIRIAWIKMA